MRANPHTLTGLNKLWVRFFLLAIYATMYVRDHARPAFHDALGVDPTWYDHRVFNICSEITKQVFPVILDTDSPAFRNGFATLARINKKIGEAQKQGFPGRVRKWALQARAAAILARLYVHPTLKNTPPATSRLQPAW